LSSGNPLAMSVSVGPGYTPVTRVPCPASAIRSACVADGLRGRAEIAGTAVLPQSLTTFAADGEVVEVTAGVDGAHVMFAAGTPTGEPVVYGGPFVMSSADQMAETKRRYGRGEMGRLEPVN
jgi:redox-sensitive bicupin YhaK (pirin superfamily)